MWSGRQLEQWFPRHRCGTESPLWLSTCSQPGHCSHCTRPQMTLFVPLDDNQPPPASPSFLVHPDDAPHHLRKALRAILKARRLVVVCGASPSADNARHRSEYIQTLGLALYFRCGHFCTSRNTRLPILNRFIPHTKAGQSQGGPHLGQGSL